MKNFAKYSQYYDLLYKDKDYKKEVDYLDSLIRHYTGKKRIKLLNIGCGTGNHDFWFTKKGYQVVGIDKSAKMIGIAKRKNLLEHHVEFYLAKAWQFNLSKRFDIAVSLFHVMSYLTVNEIFVKSLKNIYRHLKTKGVFIFDFWYGPAVLTQRPQIRRKRIIDGKLIINRLAVPRINFSDNTVDIKYKITVLDKGKGLSEVFNENHKMRYFFLPELEFMLKHTGFKILKSLKWQSSKEKLTQDSWSGVIIAQRD